MYEDSVFFVKASVIIYSSIKPWQIETQVYYTGTAFSVSIEKNIYFVTNSHVIKECNTVEIKKYNDASFVKAKVLINNPYLDLALLQCDISSIPLPISYDIPPPGEDVIICGFPLSIKSMSISKGVINRLTMKNITIANLISIQVDNLVMGGNSGGPLLHNKKVIGILNSGYEGGFAFCIPSLFLAHIYAMYKYNIEVCIADVSFKYQHLNNIYATKLKYKGKGVIITRTTDKSNLKIGDILQSIDDINIDIDGSILLSSFIKINKELDFAVTLRHYVGMFTSDKELKCKVWRDGKIIIVHDQVTYKMPTLNNFNDRYVVLEDTTIFVPLSIDGFIELKKKHYDLKYVKLGYQPGELNIILVDSLTKDNISIIRTPCIVDTVNGVTPTTFDKFIKLMKNPELDITFKKYDDHLYISGAKIKYN